MNGAKEELTKVNYVWLIAKKDGKAKAYTVHPNDAEGYINVLRDKGYHDFDVAIPSFSVDDIGRHEVDDAQGLSPNIAEEVLSEYHRMHIFEGEYTREELFQLGMKAALEALGVDVIGITNIN
ncbi:MAG: hypothetical protein K6T85_12380 [Gorillibacterium sp.]|nr:hypothetical protein [Gorillibacterium sp.]